MYTWLYDILTFGTINNNCWVDQQVFQTHIIHVLLRMKSQNGSSDYDHCHAKCLFVTMCIRAFHDCNLKRFEVRPYHWLWDSYDSSQVSSRPSSYRSLKSTGRKSSRRRWECRRGLAKGRGRNWNKEEMITRALVISQRLDILQQLWKIIVTWDTHLWQWVQQTSHVTLLQTQKSFYFLCLYWKPDCDLICDRLGWNYHSMNHELHWSDRPHQICRLRSYSLCSLVSSQPSYLSLPLKYSEKNKRGKNKVRTHKPWVFKSRPYRSCHSESLQA